MADSGYRIKPPKNHLKICL